MRFTACRSRFAALSGAAALAVFMAVSALAVQAAAPAPQRKAPPQKIDAEYTAKIKEHTQDPRMITELVDHLPASDTVPSPMKILGRIIGTPDELTYYKDIVRYFDAIDKASARVTVFRIGKTEEGRDMLLAAIADEATIKALDKYKGMTARLTDPRGLDEAQARAIIAAAKPIYHLTGALHSGETGSAEMLMELAYRLAVAETPFIQQIRNNVITLITPVLEVDGREKQVDSWYYRRKTGRAMPMVYWGQYVVHDNNRDGMGQGLMLTQNIMRTFLEWHPTVLHDLHESVPYLYTSTGAGPYNVALDPVVIDEWWMLAKHEVSEMTKRGVPGVWTGGFYDGWAPNFLFFIANTRNAIGRFYETQSYGPANTTVTLGATQTSREWYRPNPPLPTIKWGPRNNVNMQQSGVLFALQYMARNRDQMMENYYLKNRRAVERGRNEPPHAWVIPAAQRRRGEAAELVNLLRRQGVEVHAASAAFTAGGIAVAAGDYVVRMDQPYGTVVRAYFDVQRFAPGNPNPYDDTGWTMPLMRNVVATPVNDKAVLDQAMTRLSADASVHGSITGTGNVVIIDHNGDNSLATFRFANRNVKMLAAQAPFEAAGRKFGAGSFIVQGADRAALQKSIEEHGLSAWAVASVPPVKTHELVVPRIGYVHSWSNTQNEGWVRMAFDKLKIPYTYFGDIELRKPNLRQRFDVIVFPHVGGTAQSQVAGVPMTGDPIPYKKTELTPNLGVQDSADDIRGGMGFEGLMNLRAFVEEGGLLITEGSTSTIFPDYNLLAGVSTEQPTGLFARGIVAKSLFADRTSPVAYGYEGDALAVYFSQGPVLNAGGAGAASFGGRGGAAIPGVGQNLTPNATLPVPTTLQGPPPRGQAGGTVEAGGRGGAGRGGAGAAVAGVALAGRPRVILRFPSGPADILLSGGLVGQEGLVGRALVVDAPLGKGHVLLFANRPFWRWQTHGSFMLAFNAILNWNALDAGR